MAEKLLAELRAAVAPNGSAVSAEATGVGSFSIGTVPLAPQLAALHAAMRPAVEMQAMHDEMTAQIAALAVPAPWVDFLRQSNIQHLQVMSHAEGLSILVNGEPVSSLVWDGESLQATAEALAMFGAPVPAVLEQVLPLVQQLGVGVIVRFPVRAGAAVIPLYVQGEGTMAAETRQAQAEFLKAVGSPPRINVPIVYQADGSFRVGNLSDGEWREMTDLPWSMLRLDPAVLAQLSQAGVESIRLSTDTEGIHVAVNGKPLPYLSWADAEPAHLLHVTEQMTLWETWAPEMNLAGVVTVVRSPMPNTAQLATLPSVLRNGDSEALRPILANLGNRTWLMDLPLNATTSTELTIVVGEMTQMEVLAPLSKQSVVSLSGVAGTLFSTVFSIFGIFSIMAGVLLIFMCFVMLAAERRSEMGMARAIGMQRGHLVQMFVTEGMLYDLAAALVGVVLGLGVSYLMIGFLGGLFNDVSSQFSGRELFFQFRYNVSTPSIIIAYCAGVLFTLVIVTFSSYRVSRLTIVAAIRDLPDSDNGAPRSRLQKILRAVLGPLLLAGGAYVIWQYNGQGLTVILLGVTLAVIGAAFSLSWLLVLRGMRMETRRRIVYTMIGLGLVIAWGVPWGRLLDESASLVMGNPAWVPLAFALSAPMIILGGILVIMFNADAWVGTVNRILSRVPVGRGALTPVLRTAIAYPLSSRFRTGMAMTMFAMVIATVVVMSIVIQATQTLVTPDEERTADFDIQMNATLLSFFDPVIDLEREISARTPETAQNVAAVGRDSSHRLEMRRTVGEWWRRRGVSALNEGFIGQMAEVYPLRMRAEGYADDPAVWQALRERDDVAVVTSDWLAGVAADGAMLPAITIKIRNDGGEVRALQVIAMLEAQSTLADNDVLVNQDVFTALDIDADETNWFVAVKEGADVRATAQALERAFLSSGLDATVMADTFAQGQQITRGILQLFQGFMALGLLVGIAALGVISSRTVVERRQQVGMLRAIGYQPGMVALSFVLESSFIALVGIGIGTAAGVLLGRNMLGEFFDLVNPGAVTLPWLEIGGILLLAYIFSLVTTILPAYQASRIYPAEALRYE